MNGIETENCTDVGGGLNIGWIDNNDWFEYTINIPIEGDYELSIRTASANGGGRLTIQEGPKTFDELQINNTGGWQTWTTLTSKAFALVDGNKTIRLRAINGGFNLNWISFKLVDPIDTDAPTTPATVTSASDVHNISVSWTKSSDPTSSIAGYRILNNGTYYGFTADTSFTLTKLPINTTFDLSIIACDVAGNYATPYELAVSTKEPDWDLVWADEFEGNSVDRDKWYFETGNHGWGNGEAQNYTNGANASVANGNLIIEARKENSNGSDFSSTRMNNTEKYDFLYGRIEVRAKLPSTGGTWPAIWTLPRNWVYGNWPSCGEIDIMEHTGNNLNYVFGTIHTGAYNHSNGTQKGGGKVFTDVVNTYHTYTLEWYPDRLDWYYDEEIVFTYVNENKTTEEWPFDIAHYLKLNIAIGGGLGGNINYNGVWPQQMMVDYVRVYDLGFGKGDNIAPSTPSNLVATVNGINVALAWNMSTDNMYLDKYYIYQDDALIDSTTRTNYKASFLDPLTEYTFSVQAKDFGNNLSNKVSTKATTQDIPAVLLPAKIEAEDYLLVEGMETETCTDEDGGLNMAFIDEGDWLMYYIDVPSKAKYFLSTRASSLNTRGSFTLENENGVVLQTVNTPITGGWQNWETVVSNGFELNEGKQRIIIRSTANSYNINWIAFSTDSSEFANSIFELPKNLTKVYPNPINNNELTIEFSQHVGNVDLSVYTLDGRLSFTANYKNIDTQITINNLGLKPGGYLLYINNKNISEQKKLIIR